MRHWTLSLLLIATPAAARTGDERPAEAQSAAATATEVQRSPMWVAGVSAGLLARDGGSDSPFGSISATRYKANSYLRGAFTAYRGTLEQVDAALPSTYYIGSLGIGGNWNGWVADAFASCGWQDYRPIETSVGSRASEARSGSPYFAAGVRAGYAFRPSPRWFVTPTLGIQYTDSQSLRHTVDFRNGRPLDFQISERALTGNAAIRIDRLVGSKSQNIVGVSLAHFESDNGLTSWRFTSLDGQSQPVRKPMADGWNELGLSATWQLSDNLWLDNQVQRSLGAIAGDSTTAIVGLRYRM